MDSWRFEFHFKKYVGLDMWNALILKHPNLKWLFYLFFSFGHALFEWWETTYKKKGSFGQMNYDDSSIWIETIGLEKLRPLFISTNLPPSNVLLL